MSDLRFGLIGCGGLGRVHVDCVSRIPGAKFVAYADVVEQAARSALADFGGDYATDDSRRIVSDESIDAVYICTWHDSHAPLAIAAAAAGKHIFIEKPIALSLDECTAIGQAVEDAGVVLMPAFKMRFYALVRMAREFIPQPQVVVGQMMDNRWADDNWAQDPVRGGANVYSQGCHTTDILRYLAGSEPRRIWAAGGTMTHPGHPCIDQCVAAIEFENGCAASWIQGDAAQGQFTNKLFLEVFGDGKSVQLYHRPLKATFFDGCGTWVEERPEDTAFDLENREFVDALLQRRQPRLTANDGTQAMRMVVAADRAIRTREVQEF